MVESDNRFLHVNAVLQGSSMQNYRNDSVKPSFSCWLCVGWHFKRFCPFKNYRCTICSRKGHKKVIAKPLNAIKPWTAKVTVAFKKIGSHNHRKYVSLKTNRYDAHIRLGTASEITMLSRRTWEKIGKPQICSAHQSAHSVTGLSSSFRLSKTDQTVQTFFSNGNRVLWIVW